MANTIKQKRGTTDPAAGDLVVGELAINTTDGGVFTKTDGGSVVEVGAGGGGELQQDAYDNLYAGDNALSSWTGTVSSSNVVIGTNAGLDLTDGLRNVLIGKNAGQDLTTGDDNIVIGTDAYTGSAAATGNFNICLGKWTGYKFTSANNNVTLGYQSGDALTTGSNNIALGSNSLSAATTGGQNVVIGDAAAQSATGSYNTVLGRRAGSFCSGNNNVVIGNEAQYNLSMSGSNNILIGANADASTTSISNEITLGDANITSFRIPGLQSGATNGDVLTYNSTSGNIELAGASSAFTSYAVLAHVEPDGTDGGGSVIDTWTTRTINTEVADPDSIVTLSSNQFSLGAGSYLIKWTCTAFACSTVTSRLYDATNTTAIQNGICGQTGSTDSHTSVGSARVTPTGSTAYEIQQNSNITRGTDGMGRDNPATNAGEEVYMFIEIFKES